MKVSFLTFMDLGSKLGYNEPVVSQVFIFEETFFAVVPPNTQEPMKEEDFVAVPINGLVVYTQPDGRETVHPVYIHDRQINLLLYIILPGSTPTPVSSYTIQQRVYLGAETIRSFESGHNAYDYLRVPGVPTTEFILISPVPAQGCPCNVCKQVFHETKTNTKYGIDPSLN